MKTLVVSLITLIAGAVCGACLMDRYHAEHPVIQEVQIAKELTGWQLLEMAIVKTESEFNSEAVGTKKDLGIFQITPIYVKEVNRTLDSARFAHTDAFDICKSIEMFNIIQEAKNPEHDIEKAIQLHNPKGDAIGYTEKVLANFRYLSRLEEVREAIINY